MLTFELQLTFGDVDGEAVIDSFDFFLIESVVAVVCFICDLFEVGAERPRRIFAFPEPEQLGMVCVSLGAAQENGLGKQAFPPCGEKALPVKIVGVEGPESHAFP